MRTLMTNMRAVEPTAVRQTSGSQRLHDWLEEVLTKEAPEAPVAAQAAWDQGAAARDAHPREEHRLPLHVVVGAAGNDPGRRTLKDVVMGAVELAFRFRAAGFIKPTMMNPARTCGRTVNSRNQFDGLRASGSDDAHGLRASSRKRQMVRWQAGKSLRRPLTRQSLRYHGQPVPSILIWIKNSVQPALRATANRSDTPANTASSMMRRSSTSNARPPGRLPQGGWAAAAGSCAVAGTTRKSTRRGPKV